MQHSHHTGRLGAQLQSLANRPTETLPEPKPCQNQHPADIGTLRKALHTCLNFKPTVAVQAALSCEQQPTSTAVLQQVKRTPYVTTG
jgi:hypothetical protein